MKFRRLASFAFLALAACATSVAPGGGPEDKYPPRVAGVSPSPNAVNRPLELNIHLQFDEWIATSVPRSAVTISPPLEKKLKFAVDGDELYITSKARLDSNTTYTVTIASGLKDLRGNAIADPFRLTFSTGPVIDSLSVSGFVMVTAPMIKQKQYPSIGLFLLGARERASRHYLEKYRDSTGVDPDSLPRLSKEPPLFLTQTDSLGRFHLGGLRPGRYRVVAFLDLNGNQKIEPSAELAGVAEHDIVLSPEFNDTLWVSLADQDTTPVTLEAVTQLGKNSLSAKFSRGIRLDSAFTARENCALVSSDSARIFPSQVFRSARDASILFFFDSLANKDSSYAFYCLSGRDSLGRTLDSRLARLSVAWTEMKGDTLPPTRVSSVPANGAKDVLPREPMEIAYDKPVSDSLLDDLRKNLILVQNKDTLAAIVSRVDPARIRVRGADFFQTDAKVELLERYADSTLSSPDSVTGKRDTIVAVKTRQWIKFETVGVLKLASLSGTIPGGDSRTRVRIRRSDSDKFIVATCAPDGNFKMDDLVEGKYLMDYFRVQDSLDVPFAGRLAPFEPGLPWRIFADTIVVEKGANALGLAKSRLPKLPGK